MTTPLALTTARRPDDTTVLKAVGEIDMSNTDTLTSALDSLPGKLLVDLTEVEYLDSAGVSVLFTHAGRIEIIATPLLIPVLTISGLADLATVHERGA
ncbi:MULTISPECIES: STAS domain-containing protein [unclassified Streptomyces]|uniref:STAS domain-containing protein n=1 Tax=unclassified Streptomyces TaxID=2593676 RepID=UPI002E2F6930|nr:MULTISPECIES: STAS domain-containing protein [unclassified Streptomyces]WUC62870.1 STAS domain-containing protein [Streptomyces sp. NBC_00539]